MCSRFAKGGSVVSILKAECKHILQSGLFRTGGIAGLVFILFSTLVPGVDFQFSTILGPNVLATGGVLFLLLTAIAVGRSLGGSLQNRMPQMHYIGKAGRKLALYKLLAVCVVCGAAYLLGGLLVTLVSLPRFRLDLRWNDSLDSMVSWEGIEAPGFPSTVGQYWWFQMAVGLVAVLIMAVMFSAIMLLVKNAYAGTAIMVCVFLFLAAPPFEKNSKLFMGSPVAVFFSAPNFPNHPNLFPILPYFEGGTLLFWGVVAAILLTLGFVRFRRAAL